MPRNRRPLLPPAPNPREEDEGTWMLTFSDLVLLLLAFVAIGILMERTQGPHVVTDQLQASAPVAPKPVPAEPFVLVKAVPPQRETAPTVVSQHLRDLAGRLETRIAAEGIPGLRPVRLTRTSITIEIGTTIDGASALPLLPGVRPAAVTVVAGHHPHLDVSSTRDRALARATRLAHELIAGDPLLAVRAVTRRAGESAPSRVEIRLAG